MTDIAALVHRLRERAINFPSPAHSHVIDEAADALEACQARAEKAERQAEAQWVGWIKEKARAEKAEADLRTSGEYSYADLMGIHDDALEKAAEEAEIEAGAHAMKNDEAPMNAALRIAAAIRALKDKHD